MLREDKTKGTMKQMTPAEALCYIGRELVRRNLAHHLLGTISLRFDSKPSVFLVKPAGCLYELAETSDFARVYENSAPLDGSDRRPSLNFLAHAACYKVRADVGGIVHAHPEHIAALISQRNSIFDNTPLVEIPLLTQEAVWMVKNGTIPVVEDLDPEELAQAVAKKIIDANVVAIRNHGIMAVGKSIWEAYGAALVTESEAAMIIKILSMRGKPLFRSEETAKRDLDIMPPTFSPKFIG